MSIHTAYKAVGELINSKLVEQLAEQGHRMTGALESSLEVITDNNGVSGVGEKYGIFVNLGVKAEQMKHPFARARVAGLTRFAKFRMGANDKDAESIAKAIIGAWIRDGGMPTQNSYQYSNNGKRTDSIDDAIELSEPEIIDILFNEFTSVIDVHTNVTGR